MYYALMLICCCHWWWYIIFDHYCFFAPFITIVYWWYLAKYCPVSNGKTGRTHLSRTYHENHAEQPIWSSYFHYNTLNVMWYYMQAMCRGINLYYPLQIQTSSYLGFWSVGSKVIFPTVYRLCKIHYTWIFSSFSTPQNP